MRVRRLPSQRHLQEAMAKRGRVYIEGALLEHLRPHLLSPGEQWCAAGTVKLINQVRGCAGAAAAAGCLARAPLLGRGRLAASGNDGRR